MREFLGNSISKHRLIFSARGLFFAGLIVCCLSGCAPQQSGPPATRQGAIVDTLHGSAIPDPYRWLEDQNSPETREWIGLQNAYMRSIIDSLPGRENLTRRLGQLLKTDESTVPTERDGRYFHAKRLAGQDQYIIYMREGPDGEDRILVDPHPLSPDHTVSVSLWDVTDDGKIMAYIVRQGGADEEAVHLLNVENGEHLPDSLPAAVYFGFAMTDNLSGYYYTKRTPAGPRAYYHALGTDHAADRLIFGAEFSEDKIIDCDISENGRWLILNVYHGSSGKKIDIYFQDLKTGGSITPLVNDIEARFRGMIADNRIFLRTDWEAPKSRILVADLTKPARENWQEIIPAGENAMEYSTVIGGKVIVTYLENVQSKIKVYEPDGTFIRDVELPAIGAVGRIYGRWGGNEAFFSFESFHVPETIIRYDL
ncbi:S9 family peptidase, partial [Candidatus Zixiibacteriota bacterium]